MICQKSKFNHVIFTFIIFHFIEVTFAGVSSLSDEQIKTPKHDCKFNSNTFTLDCSNLNLHVIPKDIPNSVRLLNLSFNEITQIDPLMELVNLTDLDLSNNKISHIVSRETFGSLRGLRTLLLNSNKLTKIESNAFETLTNLTHLDLSHNDELELDEPFLIQHNLVELNLDFCNLKDLPDGSFTNMSQLIELTLAGNPFDEEELSTSAFTPLTKLLKLRIPNLKSPLINSLCDKLQAIDVIQFDEYNISCLVLVDNNYDMDDAFIHNDPIERPKPHSIKAPSTTTPIITEPTTTATTTMRPTVVEKSSEINAKPVTVNITTSDGGGGMSTNKTKIDTDTAQIDIDTETINMILLVILGVTISGLLIGLICRIDICGIKTKLCRSKKSKTTAANNRREPIDTVSAFEEIPLNTINKSAEAEGQG